MLGVTASAIAIHHAAAGRPLPPAEPARRTPAVASSSSTLVEYAGSSRLDAVLHQPLGRLLRVVGEDEVGAGATEGEEGLERHLRCTKGSARRSLREHARASAGERGDISAGIALLLLVEPPALGRRLEHRVLARHVVRGDGERGRLAETEDDVEVREARLDEEDVGACGVRGDRRSEA